MFRKSCGFLHYLPRVKYHNYSSIFFESTTAATRSEEVPVPPPIASTLPPDSPSSKVAHDTLLILRNTLLPLNNRLVGPLEQKADDRHPLPLVFIIGNHSSGKSTFINFALQRRIQEAGVAPTDDGFTIISPGLVDLDQDGPALVGDPDWGFRSLNTFGPSLVHHVRLKVRSNLAFKDVILVDSPGMIDSPMDSFGYMGLSKGRKDRGYDFESVVRWFADRADVILLFFDPDKPGTTGETLSVLTNSLAGMDHKFLICLNKSDVFERTSDFARTYGALTWNLSKVIPRKDLPRIFTTCTPLNTPFTSPDGGKNLKDILTIKPYTGGPAKTELDAAREEVISAIKSAPSRKLDNMISNLDAQCRLLKMHTEIIEDVRREYVHAHRKALLQVAGVGSGGVLAFLCAVQVPELMSLMGTLAMSSVIGAAGWSMYQNNQLNKLTKTLMTEEKLDSLFRKRFARELIARDASFEAIWLRIRPTVQAALENLGVSILPKVTSSEVKEINRILGEDIPALRRRAQASRNL